MDGIDFLLFPFTLIYRGFITVLLLPYYFVVGVAKVFSNNKATVSKENKTVAELKKGENIKVIKNVRSAYEKPNVPEKETDENKIKQKKFENNIKKQKEFERLVAKARKEEAKRIKEQEKKRLESEKRAKEKLAKELAQTKKEAEIEKIKAKKEEELKSKGLPATFDEKIKALWRKITKDPNEELKLEAKKTVLEEQFKGENGETTRFTKPLLFEYTARNSKGIIEKSMIEALSRVDVNSFLEAEGYEVFEIKVARQPINIRSYKMKKSRLIFYLSQLSAYLKSGIALSDAVKILDEQAKKTNEKKAWRAVYYDLSMGDELSAAMEKRHSTFPRLLINMIKTAEMTGNLTETLDDMVDYYTESESTRKQMKSAMMYPIIVSIFALIVIVFILTWVVPEFVGIYNDLGSDLPAITKVVIGISDFLRNYLIYSLIIIVLICAIYIFMFKNIKSFRKAMQTFFMHIPIFGNIIIYNEITIFSKTFANLINHNVFITDSIDVLSKITENEIYKKLIFDTATNLTKGEPISKSFKDHWAFPNIAYQMLITGEKTGRLGPMMERVSNYYQEQHRNIINQMKSLIEPIMIVSLALIVGGILLAVIIPMYGMYDAL